MAQQQTASAFATSLVLTDSEAITFGIFSFDPGVFAVLDDDRFGSADSLSRRRSVKTYIFPAKWELGPSDNRLTPHIKARLSYLEAKRDVVYEVEDDPGAGNDTDTETDETKDRVYGGYLEGGLSYQLTDAWELKGGVGLHLMQYDNSYQSSLLDDALRGETGDLLAGTHATAVVGQLQGRAIYSWEAWDVPWEFQSTLNYYAGETIQRADDLPKVKPETWSWSNGVGARWPLSKVFDTENQLRLSARRIDVGGDVTGSLRTDTYYQLGIGWLFKTEGGYSWLDNVGIKLSLNAGSALSGGSIILLYNEDY